MDYSLDLYTYRVSCTVMGADLMASDLRQLILWGIRHNLTWNAQAMGFTSQGLPSRPPFMSCASLDKDKSSPRPSSRRSRLLQPQPTSSGQTDAAELSASEILEAACNASIPGLTGVSNFTVYLYCNLFDGGEATLDPEVSHAVPDLHASCSNAAWYLSAAEDDFLWVHVCSEFFAQEFNNTVCANSSFWLQRAHQLEHPHTVPADGAVGVEVEGHQAFWTCDSRPFILVLTTVPPHTDSLGVSTKTKAGLVTEDDPLPF
ncbi:hypothetical protein NFI96_000092 [Prochilodus magdalenae]|nr:hypothetical protein NFI96_000092 [Prochilodus magdalenae]